MNVTYRRVGQTCNAICHLHMLHATIKSIIRLFAAYPSKHANGGRACKNRLRSNHDECSDVQYYYGFNDSKTLVSVNVDDFSLYMSHVMAHAGGHVTRNFHFLGIVHAHMFPSNHIRLPNILLHKCIHLTEGHKHSHSQAHISTIVHCTRQNRQTASLLLRFLRTVPPHLFYSNPPGYKSINFNIEMCTHWRTRVAFMVICQNTVHVVFDMASQRSKQLGSSDGVRRGAAIPRTLSRASPTPAKPVNHTTRLRPRK